MRLSTLRNLIKEAAKAVYGWPVDNVEHVYNVPDKMADTRPRNLGTLDLPKGMNSRNDAGDRGLDDDERPKNVGYGEMRGVSTNNKSNNDSGRGGGGGG